VIIMRLLGLRFVQWRQRGTETGGAEIDVVLSGLMGAVPTRWQVQCKNTPSAKIGVEDVAKEVGLTPITKATILMLSTSGFSKDAQVFADETMRNSSLSIFLLGKEEFESILETQGTALVSILRGESNRILSLQRVGLGAL
jgi:Restriction endonuclease